MDAHKYKGEDVWFNETLLIHLIFFSPLLISVCHFNSDILKMEFHNALIFWLVVGWCLVQKQAASHTVLSTPAIPVLQVLYICLPSLM